MFAHEETVAMISFTPRLSSLLFFFFLGLLRSTIAWHGNEMGRRGRWHQRMDIKRQAQLDPATIVRCGHPPSCQASQGCERTATAAASWHTHDIPPSAAGSTEKGPFSLMTCVTADGYRGQGERECTQRHRSVVALGSKKKSTVYFPAPASVNSEHKLTSTNCNEIHRPCTAEITVGTNPATCTHGGGLTMGVCKRFTVLLIATDFHTSAPQTTTTSQTLHCVLGMQTTQGKTGTWHFTAILGQESVRFPNYQWNQAASLTKLNRFLNTFLLLLLLFKGCALLFLTASLISLQENLKNP